MKITRKSDETKQLFETISIGSCFSCFIEGEDRIYMKTVELVFPTTYNAVCLETGHLFGFSPKLYVKPVQAELIVKD